MRSSFSFYTALGRKSRTERRVKIADMAKPPLAVYNDIYRKSISLYGNTMKTTLLHPWHEKAGARFAPFAGYDMPIQYRAGAVEEHRLCRRSVGLFDIDHMGRLIIEGKGAGEALSAVVSAPILDMKAGEARYSLLLNENGGVIDDLFVYRLEGGKWFVVVNAGNHETDLALFK